MMTYFWDVSRSTQFQLSTHFFSSWLYIFQCLLKFQFFVLDFFFVLEKFFIQKLILIFKNEYELKDLLFSYAPAYSSKVFLYLITLSTAFEKVVAVFFFHFLEN